MTNFSVLAGPCSIESQELLEALLPTLKELGVAGFRGGLQKMRTQSASFQGLGSDAYQLVREMKAKYSLPFIAEVTDVRLVGELASLVDIFQVGSRNMYNYPLLTELGRQNKSVLLKRAFSATLDEWLGAAGYIEKEGNRSIILCERGIRTFDSKLRNTLDLGSVAWLKAETDYKVYVDPSHGTGRRDLVTPMALAAVAAGADGLLLEVHTNPDQALSDGMQSIDLAQFADLMKSVQAMRSVLFQRQ